MSLKKISAVKEGKWFSLWDILAYAAIIIVAVVLIIVFAVTADRGELSGFIVNYRGEAVLEYDFKEDDVKILSQENVEILQNDSSTLSFRFYTDGRGGFNSVSVDKGARTVSVTDSDCSTHKDCVYTAALKYNGSTPIICTPHAFSICPSRFTDDGNINM